MTIVRFYKNPGINAGELQKKLCGVHQLSSNVSKTVYDINAELCYYVEINETLNESEEQILKWLLAPVFEPQNLRDSSVFEESPPNIIIEVGPRLNFCTAFSSNAVSICKSVQLNKVTRIEVAIRYLVKCTVMLDAEIENAICNVLRDRMTECRYVKPIDTFDHGFKPEGWFEVDVLKYGRSALEDVNSKLGLAFDEWDLNFYYNLFVTKLKRNPTSVECFDLAQSNSEHSRHWFFKGKMIIDGIEESQSLIDMIVDTQNCTNSNNVIKFSDNSSAIRGFKAIMLRPNRTDICSQFRQETLSHDLIFTAETHNFPTGVAPFSGATTGTGGRLRDIQGIGRGGYYIAGTAGYSVGNLRIPGYRLPWEDEDVLYPTNMATPLNIIIEASNGASDYGNKFGEPVISGFARTFGIIDDQGFRKEWIKPIMFSGGLGTVDADMTEKLSPSTGMQVVKIGGPVYRIGVGGGSASSVEVQGDNEAELDFGAVQRGDPEMEQKLNRFIRACTEMGNANPILSIHDQGAGGNGNVLKELVDPAGAVIFAKKFELGDPSISTLELWGAEYQESDAILCRSEDEELLKKIAFREKCPINFVGAITNNGKIILSEEEVCDATKYMFEDSESNTKHPVDLELQLVLGDMPKKCFNLERQTIQLSPFALPQGITIFHALDRVLRLPAVASKRYLTNKVDRCVTGLIAQQQCVGPLHTPLADVAVAAVSHFSTNGIASSIGEQPIKGLIDPAAGARMTVAEALSNLVFAPISSIRDTKCSGNWMWPAKLPGEGAALYDACLAMCSLMKELGIAIDGGKDSLSMAARVNKDVVKAPGTLVISCYAPCVDIQKVVTPDLKAPSLNDAEGCLIFIDLSYGKSRVGGTALAQVFKSLGNTVPDVECPKSLYNAFIVTQSLIAKNILLAGHDVSDGGLITCLLEMAFAGISGLYIDISHKSGVPIDILFAEEVGWILEIRQNDLKLVLDLFRQSSVPAYLIGKSTGYGLSSKVSVRINGSVVLDESVFTLMKIWEETSYRLELLQSNEKCAFEEYDSLSDRTAPAYKLSFDPDVKIIKNIFAVARVAVIREEGTNGDREMAASLVQAGFEVWDVTMQDLMNGNTSFENFRGIVFPGGFSYADVLGSGKGWAASLRFHPTLKEQLKIFVDRTDTFSLGVCNGCQLLSLLGWVGSSVNERRNEPDIVLTHNESGRFECRFSTVRIEKSQSILLRGMENSVLGVWVAHGEGRFTFRNDVVLNKIRDSQCVAIRYTDDLGLPTEKYPFNPNGSIDGIAGVCSEDGRHLAMMPHPERCTQMWQWPWIPESWKYKLSPWQRIFDNAYTWCVSDK